MRIIKWFVRAQCCIGTINARNIYIATSNKSFCPIFLQSDTRQLIPSLILDKAEGNVVKHRQKIVQVKSVCFIVSSTVEVHKRRYIHSIASRYRTRICGIDETLAGVMDVM